MYSKNISKEQCKYNLSKPFTVESIQSVKRKWQIDIRAAGKK